MRRAGSYLGAFFLGVIVVTFFPSLVVDVKMWGIQLRVNISLILIGGILGMTLLYAYRQGMGSKDGRSREKEAMRPRDRGSYCPNCDASIVAGGVTPDEESPGRFRCNECGVAFRV